MTWQSTKTYGHDLGLSCAFRQWRAKSNCKYLHGYAMGFKFIFETEELDNCFWAVDFGSMKSLKGMLEDTFDHTLVVAEDDPLLENFKALEIAGACKLVVVEAGGCEKFAELVYEVAEQWLKDAGYSPRVRLVSVEVREHGANSALFYR